MIKNCISVTSHALDPLPPVTNCHTFSDPLPLERDVLYGRPLIYHWISIVFLLYGRRIATHSVDPSLTHFLGEFPGLGLALVPDVVVPEADSGAHGAENSIQISALAGVEPRTLASR